MTLFHASPNAPGEVHARQTWASKLNVRLLRKTSGNTDGGSGSWDNSLIQDVVSLDPSEALFHVGSRLAGLIPAEVAARRNTHGWNKVKGDDKLRFWRLFLTALINPFSILLTALAIIAIATGDYATFSVMMLMVTITTVLRLWQDYKSIVKASKLGDSLSSPVHVVRSGAPAVIESKELVPGDILTVKAGDLVPADCSILVSRSFSISQSMLTGEILPVDKSSLAELDEKTEIDPLNANNIVLSGSSVAAGEATLLVLATGKRTYMASIAKSLQGKRPTNAFEKTVQRMSYLLLGVTCIMSPVVFLIQGFVNKDAGWKNALLFALSVAVGLTPEMLPVVVNANLARGAIAMARKNVIVKRLDGVQNLGMVDCCCTDKTGTLTVDRVELSSSLDGTGAASDLPRRLAYLNASLQTGSRTLLDQAIIAQDKLDIPVRKLGEIPFDSSRRLLSIMVEHEGKAYLITKGAVDEVLLRCTAWTTSSGDLFDASTESMTAAAVQAIRNTESALNAEGQRLIAVAYKACGADALDEELGFEEEHDLVFAGFLSFLDPPKPDATDAVQNLIDLGINVKILTGDAPVIATKVARDIGLLPAGTRETDVVTGVELAALSASLEHDALIERVKAAYVFAKVSPYQKRQLVQLLREGGAKVAMMGDGVNDALALQAADVGISVDSSTEIAKEASDIILLEKSLSAVAEGVVLGRKSMINTIKYLKMAASSNFGNVFSITAASAWLPYQPMQPLQILVQNLLYDLSQSVIPWDNVDADMIAKPISWSLMSVVRFMVVFGPTSSIFDIATFSLNWWFWGIQTEDSPLVAVAQTQWFIEGSITQALVVYFLRSDKLAFVRSSPSKLFGWTVLALLLVAQVVPYVPGLNDALGMQQPFPVFYGFLVAILFAYVTLVSIVKVGYVRVFKEWF